MSDKEIKVTKSGKPDGRVNNGKHLSGRPVGAKNKSTLVKEAVRGGFDDLLIEKGKDLMIMLFDEAINNKNMQAAKLLMDRALPQTKSIDLDALEKSSGLTINVQIGELEQKVVDGVVIEEGEIVDETV